MWTPKNCLAKFKMFENHSIFSGHSAHYELFTFGGVNPANGSWISLIRPIHVQDPSLYIYTKYLLVSPVMSVKTGMWPTTNWEDYGLMRQVLSSPKKQNPCHDIWIPFLFPKFDSWENHKRKVKKKMTQEKTQNSRNRIFFLNCVF